MHTKCSHHTSDAYAKIIGSSKMLHMEKFLFLIYCYMINFLSDNYISPYDTYFNSCCFKFLVVRELERCAEPWAHLKISIARPIQIDYKGLWLLSYWPEVIYTILSLEFCLPQKWAGRSLLLTKLFRQTSLNRKYLLQLNEHITSKILTRQHPTQNSSLNRI